MDTILEILKQLKTGDKFNDFVIDDAITNINNTKESLLDPETFYKNSEFNTKTFLKAFPFIYFIQQQQLADVSS